MSKKLFIASAFFSFLLCAPIVAQGQDLIVTNTGDSLNVFITKEKNDYVYFIVESEGTGERVNSLMATSDIKSMVRDHYLTPVVSKEVAQAHDRSGLRVGVQGGYSRRMASSPDGLNDEGRAYYNELKNGYTYSGDFTYYFNERSGIGVSANMYRSKAGATVMIEEENSSGQPSYHSAQINDDVSILYIGPFYSMRFYNWNYENFGWMRFGVGYNRYKNNFQLFDELIFPFTMTSETFGISIEFGYDLRVSENIALGFGIGINSGVLTEVVYDYPDGSSETIKLESDEYEGLGRIDFTIGLRFLQ